MMETTPAAVCLMVLNSILAIVTVLENLLVVITICRTRTLHTLVNYFIASLAFTDFLVGLIILPMTCYAIRYSDSMMYSFAHAFSFLCTFFVVTSWMMLCVISVERCYVITTFRRERDRTGLLKGIVWTLFAWFVGIIFGGANLMIRNKFYYSLLHAGLMISVGIVITVSYVLIFRTVKRSRMTKLSDCRHHSLMQRRWRVAKAVVCLISSYMVCWLPNGIVFFIWTYYRYREGRDVFTGELFFWTTLLGFSNSSVNFLFYCWRNDELRRSIKNTMNCLLGRTNKVFNRGSPTRVAVLHRTVVVKQ